MTAVSGVDAERAASDPVFVMGIPRSGTTLISMMLSAHPAFAIAPDLHYIHHWAVRCRRLNLSRTEEFDRFWRAFSSSPRFGYLGLDADTVREHIQINNRYSFRGVYLSVLESFAALSRKRRWGEKTPFTADHLETLFDWFPDARVVYMLRDPRAVVSSFLKLPWLDEKDLDSHSLSWARGVARALVDGSDRRIMHVRYEALVYAPANVLGEVCSFLGESYWPEMLNRRDLLEESMLRGREGWEREHVQAALSPVHRESVQRWRHELTAEEVDIIESHCGAMMQETGYPLSSIATTSDPRVVR